MQDTIEFGIGFVTGRPNVCKIINSYYKQMLEQIEKVNKQVNITIFILYDLKYQFTTRVDFYGIIPAVYKNIKIKYITPEDIEEEKKILISRNGFKKEDLELIFGHGHAKGRNTVMYYALKMKMNYLLFWDDDEYPIAVTNEDNKLNWIQQDNILKHIEYIKDSDITIGHHCGYISPIPYIKMGQEVEEEDFRKYIEAISNEVISWKSISDKMKLSDGITYADINILNNSIGYQLENVSTENAVVGSTLCINLNSYKKIPAFYNPIGARGEDTFFSSLLSECKVIKVPVYHFHDGFLKCMEIMKGRNPKKLRKISLDEENIEYRFLQASLGWIKYKPLYTYITDKENYVQKVLEIKSKLEESIPKINKIFRHNDLKEVLESFNICSKKVEEHYDEYCRTNEVWKNLKDKVVKE